MRYVLHLYLRNALFAYRLEVQDDSEVEEPVFVSREVAGESGFESEDEAKAAGLAAFNKLTAPPTPPPDSDE